MAQVVDLYARIQAARAGESIPEIGDSIAEIKNKNIETFDLLNKQDELLS